MSVVNDINRQKMRRAQRELHTAQTYGGRRLRGDIIALRRDLIRDFASERHWIVARTEFSLGQLVEGRPGRNLDSDYWYTRLIINDRHQYFGHDLIDHCEYFRQPKRPYRPAALLTHCYSTRETMAQEADTAGLNIEFLPWSWYYVDNCTAALLTRRVAVPLHGVA